MKSERLEWDSGFFGISVGRVTVSGPEETVESLCDAVDSLGCELAYVFLPLGGGAKSTYDGHRRALSSLGGTIVDRKVVFRKPLVGRRGDMPQGCVATGRSRELEALAHASGWCSRFFRDDRLAPLARRMYGRWLENDLARGRVFVYPDASAVRGMVTVSTRGGVGKVGLLAVDARHCGQGIGLRLLEMADAWFAEMGVGWCEVVTQGLNAAACRLYEKAGYRVSAQWEVWHVWRSR